MWLVIFYGAAFLIAMTPGANNLLGMHHATKYGSARALLGIVAGRLPAITLMIAAVAAGLGPLLAASETALTIIKWAGAAYLAYLGIRMLINTFRRGTLVESTVDIADGPRKSLARKEFLVCIGNPKAILIITAFLPQFVSAGHGPVALQIVILGAVYLLSELSAGAVFVAIGAVLKAMRMSLRARRNVDRGTGVLLLGLAGALATAR